MVELLLSLLVLLLGVLVALVGWLGREGLAALRNLAGRFDMLARLHLRHHPEDLPQFKIGGSI